MNEVRFLLNDRAVTVHGRAALPTLTWLRENRESTGTKEGCGEGECGACAVLLGEPGTDGLSYRAVPSCLLPLGDLAGRHLLTVEGLNPATGLTPVQQSLVDEGAPQCGFCFPGIVLSLTGFFLTSARLAVADAVTALDGNICRCTGYASILRAITALSAEYGPRLDQSAPRVPQLVAWGVLPAFCGEADTKLAALAVTHDDDDTREAVLLGGGTDLIVQRPHDLPDRPVRLLSRAPDLHGITPGPVVLTIGGAVTIGELGRVPEVAEVLPTIGEVASRFGSTLVRNRATVAGNLVNASPIGDLTVTLLAANAELELVGGGASRRLPLRDFYLGYKELDLRDGELVRSVRVPRPLAGTVSSFEKISRRHRLDIAGVNGAAVLRLDDNVIAAVDLALGGVAAVPLYLSKTVDFLVGKQVTAATVLAAAAVQDKEISPIDDVRGSARYKRLLARRILFAHLLKAAPTQVRLEELV